MVGSLKSRSLEQPSLTASAHGVSFPYSVGICAKSYWAKRENAKIRAKSHFTRPDTSLSTKRQSTLTPTSALEKLHLHLLTTILSVNLYTSVTSTIPFHGLP